MPTLIISQEQIKFSIHLNNKGRLKKEVVFLPKVKCSVQGCYYWESGNKCNADEILVRYTDHTSMPQSDVEFGLIGGNKDKETTDDTCCETFRPKKKT